MQLLSHACTGRNNGFLQCELCVSSYSIDVCWSACLCLYDALFSRGSVSVLQLSEQANRERPISVCMCVVRSLEKASWLDVSQQETSLCFSKNDDYINSYLLQAVMYIRWSI